MSGYSCFILGNDIQKGEAYTVTTLFKHSIVKNSQGNFFYFTLEFIIKMSKFTCNLNERVYNLNCIINYSIILILLFCGFLHKASAESMCDSTIVQQFRISYPVNQTELHADYHDNATNLRIIKEYFLKSPKIDSIIIYSFSSPEGPYKTNKRLAEERGKRARNYLVQMLPEGSSFPDSLIIIKPTAENWDGLYEKVACDYPYEDKDDVLNLLSRKDISNDRKKQLLKNLNRGIPWEYIKTNILPHLRYAVWVAEWVYVPHVVENIPHITPVTSPAKQINALSALAPRTVFIEEESRKTILALKTNLLYDALSFANFSIEAPLY